MKKFLTPFLLFSFFVNFANAESVAKFSCTDAFYGGSYVLDLAVRSCKDDQCTLEVSKHDSPTGCEDFEQSFAVSAQRKGELLIYKSSTVKVTINTGKAPNRKLLEEFGRPYGKKPLSRGQARFLGPIEYPTPTVLPCVSTLAAKYSQLVCVVRQ